ncbi:bifunctional 2-polyprenyl-6-hydroxyphenol methylase/3-demethylubiquinol 3-O-methyltransferase UbiG [Corynebacterium sp. HS2168-gen11]|uniref:class I SAM-dependent methyltransferase n=1 Tax=Corynebacterium sp. HS2168-gen11 TaxID=2974027 RepID=UPI00216ACB88|nr:class I SAM-dependent methyltransferase [Corynebacterium sp. HS2168-gen11]MCS4534814.1 class I SAM-dependent methyltransferase [Corynebacterium sp. HS2168-gen11]
MKPEHDMYHGHNGRIWSGNPNDALMKYATDVVGNTALDIGAGEGADSAWLLTHDFAVTAVEPSPIAAAVLREQAPTAHVLQTTFEQAELATYDLVTAFYTPLLDTATTVTKLLEAVARGGTLLVVHHDDISKMAAHFGRSIDEFLLPPVLAKHLEQRDDFEILANEQSSREVTTGQGAAYRIDLVLKAKRT